MCRKQLFISICLLLLSGNCCAQQIFTPPGARAAGMGHCGLNTRDIWSTFNNQAGMACHESFGLGLALENRYLLKETARISICSALSAGKGALFAAIDHFGDQTYSEMKAGAGYALQIGKHVSAGLQLDYMRLSFGEGYGNFHAFTMEGGLLVQAGDKISLGLYCFNPVSAGWVGTEEKLPVMYRTGACFKPERSISIHAEVHLSDLSPAIFTAACEYQFKERFFLRAGISNGISSISFGAGYKIKRMRVDFASSWHSYLGFSSQLSLTYSKIK